MTGNHERYMSRAIQLARRGWYTTRPNPRVGCVLVKDGEIVGEGWHHRAGEYHAEVNALREAGDAARSSTAYVTLEPCSHQGRTPPCVEALIDAGIKTLVYGVEDANPLVSGKGLMRLSEAGIEVIGPLLEVEARDLNAGYFKRHRLGLPRVSVKLAMSLDGRTAMANGESKWITGPAARRDVQRLRAASCAIITGIGTVVRDNPLLTVRPEVWRPNQPDLDQLIPQPLRVILDSVGQLSENAALLKQPGPVVVVSQVPRELSGAEVISIGDPERQVDLPALLAELARRECNEVLVEAGATLAGAFVSQQLVDELVIYMAPKLLGNLARPLLTLPIDSMAEQIGLDIKDIRAVGKDWRITAAPKYLA